MTDSLDQCSGYPAIAVIPARGGSKGIPGKNIADVAGRPLIAWTISAALDARSVSRVIVSTDDPAIAAVAKDHGAEVPFLRPAELALDETLTIPVIRHAIEWLGREEAVVPPYVAVLQPTSPLRGAEDIDAAFQVAVEREADCVVAVFEPHGHPFWCKTTDFEGKLVTLGVPYTGSLRRQDLPRALMPNGSIYIFRTQRLLDGDSHGERVFPYVMSARDSLDIDTPWELELARLILSNRIPTRPGE